MRFLGLSVAVLFLLCASPAAELADIDGTDRAVPDSGGTSLSLVFFVTTDCPISNRYAPEFERICSEFSPSGVQCLMAYVDPSITAGQIRAHREAFGITPPAVRDVRHELVNLAGATVTPEAAVIDPAGLVLYRGRVNNLYAALGTPRRRATVHDLRDALEQALSGKAVNRPRTQAVGCFIPTLGTTEQ